MEYMQITDVIIGMMAGVASATGSGVALCVLDTDVHTGPDGVARLLPMVAVATGGYARIPDELRDAVSQHFGALLPVAELRAEVVNRAYGLDPVAALELIDRSMAMSSSAV
jgi:hypothetical protein